MKTSATAKAHQAGLQIQFFFLRSPSDARTIFFHTSATSPLPEMFAFTIKFCLAYVSCRASCLLWGIRRQCLCPRIEGAAKSKLALAGGNAPECGWAISSISLENMLTGHFSQAMLWYSNDHPTPFLFYFPSHSDKYLPCSTEARNHTHNAFYHEFLVRTLRCSWKLSWDITYSHGDLFLQRCTASSQTIPEWALRLKLLLIMLFTSRV